jgi:hypothetical protein
MFVFFFLPGSVGLVSRFGQFYKSVDPGLVQVNICTESLRVVDVKIQIIPIGRQSVMYVLPPSLHAFIDLPLVHPEPGTTSTSKCTPSLPCLKYPPKFICIVIIQRLRRLLPNQQPLPLRLRHQRPPQSPH